MELKKPGKRKKKSALQKKKDSPNSKYWKNKADKEWGRVIHLQGCCMIGDKCKGNLEAHHLISRSNITTRHNILNGVLLCSLHHKFSKDCSPHMAPIQFSEFLRVHHPEKIVWVMHHRYETGKPNYKESYEKLVQITE